MVHYDIHVCILPPQSFMLCKRLEPNKLIQVNAQMTRVRELIQFCTFPNLILKWFMNISPPWIWSFFNASIERSDAWWGGASY